MLAQKNKIFTLVIFGILLLAPFVAQATLTPPLKDKITVLSNNAGAIHLQFINKSLVDVAAAINQRSTIKLQIAPVLNNHLITANIQAKNWQTAMSKLLKGYNHVGFINDSGRITRILITGINSNGADAIEPRKELFSLLDDNLLQKIPDHLQKLPIESVTRIKFNKSMLKKMALGEVLSLSLPAGQFNVIHDNFMVDKNGDFTWIGYLEDTTPKNRVIISFDDKSSFGRILTPEGVFRVETSEGLDWLVDVDSAGLKPGTLKEDTKSNYPLGVELPETDGALKKGKKLQITQQTTAFPFKRNRIATKDSKNSTEPLDDSQINYPAAMTDIKAKMVTIDVMVLYTDGLAANRINYLIATSNQAFIDSNVQIQLRLVHTQRVNYNNHNLNETALYDLSNDRSTLSEISALRETHGADLVSLIRQFDANAHQGCGIAWLGGSGGRDYIRNEAYSVISDGIDDFNYCTDYTFVHELGHNMGSTHDRQNARYYGRFPYSYGYNVDGRYGTIMSYSGMELGLFSNPNIDCLDQPCGISAELENGANNTLSLNNSAVAIAGFMKSAYPMQRTEKFK